MKIAEIQTLFLNTVGTYLKQKGFTHAKTMKLRLPTDPELIEIWEKLPTNILPVGEDDSGDMIALKFDNNTSEIVIYSHENNSFQVEGTAKTFTELLCTTQKE